MAILSFGLGLLAIMVTGVALTIGAITYHRFRRPWQLLYLVCAFSWVIDLIAYYLGWFAFELSGPIFTASRLVTWLTIPLLPLDVVVTPLWFLQLAGRSIKRRTVLLLSGNFALAMIPLLLLVQRFAQEGAEARPIDLVLWALLMLQIYGVYFGSLGYAWFALRDRSIAAPRRDFRFVLLVVLAAVLSDIFGGLVRGENAPDSYAVRLDLPLAMLVGFGYMGARQARRLFGSKGVGGPVVAAVDEMFFAEYGLSPRERQVALRLRSKDKTREIAAAMHLSEATINSHIRSIYRKCDIHSRVELVAVMRRYEHGAGLGNHHAEAAIEPAGNGI